MGPVQNLQEFFSALRRRWQVVALAFLLGAVGGLVVAMNTQRLYSASAVIQVITPVIAVSEGGAATPVPDITRRVQIIEQRLMSRDALLDLAQRYDLFDGTALSPVEQVAMMRESFSISAIAAAQQGFSRDGSLSALIVSASDDDPETAAAIANELAESLVRESRSDRQSATEQAVQFFSEEENRLESAIAVLEDEIAAYRSANEAYLPDAVTQRRAERARLVDSLLEMQQEILARRNELASLDTRAQRAVTQRRIDQLNDEIAQFTQQAAIITQRVEEIQAVLQAAPTAEQQLVAMNRRVEQFQVQLTAAADRRREAELGARIEADQQAERFELLERALVPEYPISRPRKTVLLLAAIGGLMLGLMAAYALEWQNPVIRTAARFERDLQLRPVISIPCSMPAHERRRRRLIWVFGLVVLIAGLGLGAAIAGLF